MRKLLFLSLVCVILTALSACVSTLPTSMPPEESPSAAATPAPASDETPDASEAATPAAVEPAPTPEPTPIVIDPVIARDAALDYIRGSFQLKLPANETFAPDEMIIIVDDGFETAASYTSGPWTLQVAQPMVVESRSVSPARLRFSPPNGEVQTRWSGDVDTEGVVSTTVSAGIPKPRSQRIAGWEGRVVKLPPGSIYDDYFEGGQGNRHGIDSNVDNVLSILDSLTDYQGRVKVWGELRFAVQDYNGRKLLINRIELLDSPPPDTAAEPAPAAETPAAPAPILGPTGALINPLPGVELFDRVRVVGEAEGVFENQVIVRAETSDGAVIGQSFATIDATEMGQRGQFNIELLFDATPAPGTGRVALYAENPQDGSLLLLAWVNVNLAGAPNGQSAEIRAPEPGATLKGSVVVKGSTTGVTAAQVLVQVEDLAGTVWGQAQARLGENGEWEVKLRLRTPPTARPGRVAVYEQTDAGLALLAYTNVDLAR